MLQRYMRLLKSESNFIKVASKIVLRTRESKMNKQQIIELIKSYDNPYPEDIFCFDNKERLDIRQGRLNEFVHQVVENTRQEILKLIEEEIDVEN